MGKRLSSENGESDDGESESNSISPAGGDSAKRQRQGGFHDEAEIKPQRGLARCLSSSAEAASNMK